MLQNWMSKVSLVEAYNKALREAETKYNLGGTFGGVRGIELETPVPHMTTLQYKEVILHVNLPDPREQPEAAVAAISAAYDRWHKENVPQAGGSLANAAMTTIKDKFDQVRQKTAGRGRTPPNPSTGEGDAFPPSDE